MRRHHVRTYVTTSLGHYCIYYLHMYYNEMTVSHKYCNTEIPIQLTNSSRHRNFVLATLFENINYHELEERQ